MAQKEIDMAQADPGLMRNEVGIPGYAWQKRGGLIMLWIHNNIGEDCYRLRFDGTHSASALGSMVHEKHTTIIFDEDGQAMLFKVAFPFEVLDGVFF